MNVKQVIVVRKDLKIRRGKEIAQGAHASGMWLAELILHRNRELTDAERDWLLGSYRKITLQVSSERALIDVYNAAKDAGLEVHMITDLGATEFHGVPTLTALAIGPDLDEKIDPITGQLEMY